MRISDRLTGRSFNAEIRDGKLINVDTNCVLSGHSITMFLDEASEQDKLDLKSIGCALSGNAIYRIGLKHPMIETPLPPEPEAVPGPPALLAVEAEPDAVAKNWLISTLGLLFSRAKRWFS